MTGTHLSTEKPGTLSPADEAALMQRIAQGDRIAFSHVVDGHMNGVYQFCYRILGNHAQAEDAAQDCFIRLWNNASSWQPTGKIKSWLLRIAHNLCIDEIRSFKSYDPIEDHEFRLASVEPDPHQALQRLQDSKEVKDALAQLPERQRMAITLVHYSECPQAEAASIMGVSVDAVESLLARGKRGLKEILGERGREIIKEAKK